MEDSNEHGSDQSTPAVDPANLTKANQESTKNSSTPAVVRGRPRKKIIVCCDGTCNNELDNPDVTNVTRFARCVSATDKQGIPQLVRYMSGVGTGTSSLSNAIEAATGRGLYENILGAYNFIAYNFETRQDEIHLVGFSRGAFTARGLAQLINEIGILTKRGLGNLRVIFDAWKEGNTDQVQHELERIRPTGDLIEDVRVRTCAVWDTVGSFALPMPAIVRQPAPRKLKFINSALCPNIDNAFQALSLHEHRRHFQAIVWKKPPGTSQILKQCWFHGFHSDIGGGNEEGIFAHFPLMWIFDQMMHFVDLDPRNLWIFPPDWNQAAIEADQVQCREDSVSKERTMEQGRKQIQLGQGIDGLNYKVKESQRGVFAFGGSSTRRPCQYFWGVDGLETDKNPTANMGQETIHFSVRALLDRRSLAPPPALQDAEVWLDSGRAIWMLKTKKSSTSFEIPEAEVTIKELRLLQARLQAELTHRQQKSIDAQETQLAEVLLWALGDAQVAIVQ